MKKKLAAYSQALVKVNDDGEVFISSMPWPTFFLYKVLDFLHLIKSDRPHSVKFLFPWQWQWTVGEG